MRETWVQSLGQEDPRPGYSWGSGLGDEVFRELTGWLASSALLRLTSIESVMPSSHLILCHPLLLLPPIPPNPVEFGAAPPNCTVSLTSQRHPEKLPEVTGISRRNPGFPAVT